MNKAKRKAVADLIEAVVVKHGGTVWRDDRPEDRETFLLATLPGVKFSADIGDKIIPMLHWHQADRPLAPAVMGEVNTCHFRKATTYGDEWGPGFILKIDQLCAAVADGTAFTGAEA